MNNAKIHGTLTKEETNIIIELVGDAILEMGDVYNDGKERTPEEKERYHAFGNIYGKLIGHREQRSTMIEKTNYHITFKVPEGTYHSRYITNADIMSLIMKEIKFKKAEIISVVRLDNFTINTDLTMEEFNKVLRLNNIEVEGSNEICI